MTFEDARQTLFPGSLSDSSFIEGVLRVTAPLGFAPDDTLLCVGVCRDEICQPFVAALRRTWGDPFLLGGLGGMLFCGRTGLAAALSHAPVRQGRERCAYICMPHIGLGPDGEPGQCVRPTREKVSTACGALMAFHGAVRDGKVASELDPTDLEQGLLTRRLTEELGSGQKLDLVELTQLARGAIAADLERAIDGAIDPHKTDYFVCTGVQIHAPDGSTYIHPAEAYAIVDGARHELDPGSGSEA